VLAVLGSLFAESCVSESTVRSMAPVEAAFDMVVLGEVACSDDVSATTCLNVKITNVGEVAGTGFCRPRGHETGPNGEDIAVFGDRIDVVNLAGGANLVTTVAWTKPIPESRAFVGDCSPSPHS
jgi:hypothetical protein